MPWYFLLDIVLCLSAFFICVWAWPRLRADGRIGNCVTAVLVMALQSGNEILSRQVFHAWSFGSLHNRMIGVLLWGEPLEEYLFWWAFAWMIPFLYSGLAAGLEKNNTMAGIKGGIP